MKKNIIIVFTGVLFFVIGIYLGNRNTNGDEEVVQRTRIILGTLVEIKTKEIDEETANKAINLAFAEFQRIDNLFSTYNEESPVWKFNHSNAETLSVNEEIFLLMKKCDYFTGITEGAFDIALENVIEAWGFNTQSPKVPGKDSLLEALNRSGWKNIELFDQDNIIAKNGVEINFGAVAKGYAVDRAFEILKSKGIDNFLINAGGEIRQNGNDWIVGIQHPRDELRFIERLQLKDKAVATSGDYENYFITEGVRYHHIISPFDGKPASGCQSVTVIADDCTTADALATGIFVMGVEAGLALAESRNNIEVLIIDFNGNKHLSKDFNKYILR